MNNLLRFLFEILRFCM